MVFFELFDNKSIYFEADTLLQMIDDYFLRYGE